MWTIAGGILLAVAILGIVAILIPNVWLFGRMVAESEPVKSPRRKATTAEQVRMLAWVFGSIAVFCVAVLSIAFFAR